MTDLSALAGQAVGSLLLLLVVAAGAVAAFGIPFFVWSIARSLRRANVEIARVADALEHANRGVRDEFRDLELQRRGRIS